MLGAENAMTIHDFSARLGTGEERRLTDYRGKVLLGLDEVSVDRLFAQCLARFEAMQTVYEDEARSPSRRTRMGARAVRLPEYSARSLGRSLV